MLAAVSEHCTPQKVRFEEMARVYVFRWPAGSQMEGRQGGPQGLVDALSPISISEWKEIKMFNMRLILIREWHGAGWSCDFPPLHVICCLTPSHCTNLKPYMCEHEHVCVCASTHVCVHVWIVFWQKEKVRWNTYDLCCLYQKSYSIAQCHFPSL